MKILVKTDPYSLLLLFGEIVVQVDDGDDDDDVDDGFGVNASYSGAQQRSCDSVFVYAGDISVVIFHIHMLHEWQTVYIYTHIASYKRGPIKRI